MTWKCFSLPPKSTRILSSKLTLFYIFITIWAFCQLFVKIFIDLSHHLLLTFFYYSLAIGKYLILRFFFLPLLILFEDISWLRPPLERSIHSLCIRQVFDRIDPWVAPKVLYKTKYTAKWRVIGRRVKKLYEKKNEKINRYHIPEMFIKHFAVTTKGFNLQF